jgi:glyoxylase-like metal-dependent hydrolase (beta-lactamase superfamily II)
MKRLTLAIIAMIIGLCAFAQSRNPLDDLKTVYKDKNVTFRKIDKNTWVGSGNVMSSETIYIVEGKNKAVIIDAGTTIPGLDKIVKKITKKPVTLILTHVHPDHAGAVGCFDEVWINPADTVNVPVFMPDYKGSIKYLEHGQMIELGGRTLETYFTPGHTPGSTTFLEIGTDHGFSGDSFGNGNLLVFSDFKTLIQTCRDSYEYFTAKGYKKFYCGHFFGVNFDTPARVKLIEEMAVEVLEGKIEGEPTEGFSNMNRVVVRDGFRLNYNDINLAKERFSKHYDTVAPKDFDENIFELVGDDWTVITSGDQPNSMVASWGGTGIMFNKPVTWCFLRANRYTLEKIKETGTYTMCYFPADYKGDILKFGTASGRNTDKMAQTKLTPMTTPDRAPAYKEAKIIIECKLIAAPTVSKDEFYTEEGKEFLQGGYDEAKDWHKLVFGEITNIYVKK